MSEGERSVETRYFFLVANELRSAVRDRASRARIIELLNDLELILLYSTNAALLARCHELMLSVDRMRVFETVSALV